MTADKICSQFTDAIPLFLSNRDKEIKLEIKPYLQPFERILALRELQSLTGNNVSITEECGFWLVNTDISIELLRSKLTYWQRIGLSKLEPTLQVALELTQNGINQVNERMNLHRARRLRYGPHDLHEYRGKFFPQLVRSLINISGIPKGAVVLDPMCGSGTTPCEAVAEGMTALGIDLNPLSSLIASVKSSIPMVNAKTFKNNMTRYLSNFNFSNISPEKIWNKDDLRYLKLWFDPVALDDLASIVSNINNLKLSFYRDFFRVCLSNVIRSVSWQKITDLRVRKEITTYDAETAQKLFLDEVHSQENRIHPYLSVLNHNGATSLEIRNGNAIDIMSIFYKYHGKVDLIITSPPYATALPYLDTDRLSLIILGLLHRKEHGDVEQYMIGTREISERERLEAWSSYEERKKELPCSISSLIDKIAKINHGEGIGFRRRNLPALLGKYFLSMLDVMRSTHKMLKPGSSCYYVVGNNSTILNGEKVVIPTDNFLFELGDVAGWNPTEKIPMELIVSRDVFRGNRGSSESILCFKS